MIAAAKRCAQAISILHVFAGCEVHGVRDDRDRSPLAVAADYKNIAAIDLFLALDVESAGFHHSYYDTDPLVHMIRDKIWKHERLLVIQETLVKTLLNCLKI